MTKKLLTLAALVAATTVITGCTSAPNDAANGGPIELTFWHGYTEADGDVLEQIVADFNESQDDVVVSTEVNPWAVIDDTLLPALSADNGPQIVAMPAERMPVYAASGALSPLDDFYADESSNTASLNENAVDMVTVDGSKYGVPTGFVPLAMFYNKALFAAAGITEVPETWDDWVATAKQLTVDANGDGEPEQYGLVLPDHATVANGVWPSLFYGNGGSIVEGGDTATIDSPENAETLEFWVNAIRNEKISPTGVDGIAGDGLFSASKGAMYLGGPWMAFISADNNIDYGIAPVPAGPVDQAASAIGITMSVTEIADDAEREAAEAFFAYFLESDVAVEWSLGSGWPPLRTDVDASLLSENADLVALTEQAQFGRPLLPGVVNSTDVLAAVDELTQRAVAGENIDDLLAGAQAEIQAALDDQ